MLDKNLLLNIPDGVCLSTDDPLVFEKQVIYVGSFKKWNNDGTLAYEFGVDEPTIDHWVRTHEELIGEGLDVPMPHGHDETKPRKATALSLSKKADSKGRISLFAKLKFNDVDCAKTFKNSQVSLYSPPSFKHQDKTFVRPIRHICFTDYPVIGDLDPFTVAASYDLGGKMNMKSLAKALNLSVKDDATDEQISEQIVSAFKAATKPADTKPADDKKKPAVAASQDGIVKPDPVMISLARDNRDMKIDKLVSQCKITSAAGKDLKAKWVEGDALSLSAESNSAFDSIMSTLNSLEPIVALSGEQTGAQKAKTEESSLVKNAQKMNKARA